MRKAIIAIIISVLASASLSGQGRVASDSLVYRQISAVDSSLCGKSVFDVMPSRAKGAQADVAVHQNQAIINALKKHISEGADTPLAGYRVRIFFDNQRTARNASEEVMRKFLDTHHGIEAYRSYQNPFFKVTVGDFRTKSEAVELLGKLKGEFPAAFVVRENINYPPVDKEHSYVVDTVRVYR